MSDVDPFRPPDHCWHGTGIGSEVKCCWCGKEVWIERERVPDHGPFADPIYQDIMPQYEPCPKRPIELPSGGL